MIRTEHLYKSFNENHVLNGITTEFFPGKTNLIIGRSGSGKTVLLKLLVGLLAPDNGVIYYDDVNFCQLNKKEVRTLRMKVGMLFQASALFDSLTVEENVRFPLDMFTNMTAKEKHHQVNHCLERVNLEGANRKFPSEVSGGMQKRVGIARAIVLNPRYLFCDEPNSGLDPKTALVIDELIRSITQDYNITTVINTHDMNSVMEIGDNVVLLHTGKIAWRGDRHQVLGSDNEILKNFIFASPFLQRLRNAAMDAGHTH
jgi:phospholipid/cholesterol/gamma-HCH transport system ATP-binding protein